MDAHVGNQEEPFVVEMAADAAEGFMLLVASVIVGIMFLPLFAYGLGVSVRDFAKVRYLRVRKYLTKSSTKSRYEIQASKANS